MKSLLNHITSLRLKHKGYCTLLGVSSDLVIYVEETYGEDDWIAQHALRLDGQVLATIDEDHDNDTGTSALCLPDALARPQRGTQTEDLNFVGPRLRGLREPERVHSLLSPLPMGVKIALVKRLDTNMLPPMILGLAESYVLSEAVVVAPDLFAVCRRVRVAYALSQVLHDENNQPYDYDTITLYIAHLYDRESQDEILTEDALAGLPGVETNQPMDCLVCDHRLFVADSGTLDAESAVHVWQIESPDDRHSRRQDSSYNHSISG